MARSEVRFEALGVRTHILDIKIDREDKMIKNNRFSEDKKDERIERLTLLSANIETYGPMIGVPVPKIDRAKNAFDVYVGAIAIAGVEDGQMDEAFETYHNAIDELARYYSLVRAHLQEIIWEFEKPDDFINSYGFEGDSPTWASGLIAKITQWYENHILLVAAGDSRVLPDAVMAELVSKRDNMVSLHALSQKEKRESSEAYDNLHDLFNEHTKLLRFILTAAHLVWGNEDPRLLELGFQTASGVWTPGQPEPPVEELPPWPGPMEIFTVKYLGASTVEVIYSGVQEVSFGDLSRRRPGTEDWVLVAENLPMAPEEIFPFREFSVPNGEWEYMLVPLRGNEKGIPSYATVEVVGAPR